jgi:hypothetical protein
MEKPPDLNLSFETSTENLLDGRTSSPLGVQRVSRRCGFLSDVMTLPNAIGPLGGISHVEGM